MTSKSRRISTETPKPQAWVVNASDRGRKSVKPGNKIYLQDGQEFQIELHNPLTESVLADIYVLPSVLSCLSHLPYLSNLPKSNLGCL